MRTGPTGCVPTGCIPTGCIPTGFIPTGCITEKHEVRCCRYCSGASCFDELFCGRIGSAVGAPFDGLSPGSRPGGVIFITVNQVLVRLWARRGRKSDRMWSVSREGSSWGTGPPAIVADVFRDVCVCMPPVVHCPPPQSGVGPGGSEQDDPVQDRPGGGCWCSVPVVSDT